MLGIGAPSGHRTNENDEGGTARAASRCSLPVKGDSVCLISRLIRGWFPPDSPMRQAGDPPVARRTRTGSVAAPVDRAASGSPEPRRLVAPGKGRRGPTRGRTRIQRRRTARQRGKGSWPRPTRDPGADSPRTRPRPTEAPFGPAHTAAPQSAAPAKKAYPATSKGKASQAGSRPRAADAAMPMTISANRAPTPAARTKAPTAPRRPSRGRQAAWRSRTASINSAAAGARASHRPSQAIGPIRATATSPPAAMAAIPPLSAFWFIAILLTSPGLALPGGRSTGLLVRRTPRPGPDSPAGPPTPG